MPPALSSPTLLAGWLESRGWERSGGRSSQPGTGACRGQGVCSAARQGAAGGLFWSRKSRLAVLCRSPSRNNQCCGRTGPWGSYHDSKAPCSNHYQGTWKGRFIA